MPRGKRFGPRLIVAASAVALGLALFALLIGARAFRMEAASFHPERGPVALPADPLLRGLRPVAFHSDDGTALAGWYLPSRTGAAVLLLHGSEADRTQLLPEARLLAPAGFGLLLFDWPGHGESAGMVHWGAGERAALRAATDWLSRQRDLNPARLGALGFSSGGAILVEEAATDPRLRALVLEGTYSDAAELTCDQFKSWGLPAQLGALFADRHFGMDLHEPQPVQLVAALAPRPLFIIAGENDSVVPNAMAHALYAAAAEPKTLWIIPGCGHGGYAQAASGALGPRLTQFFLRALSPR